MKSINVVAWNEFITGFGANERTQKKRENTSAQPKQNETKLILTRISFEIDENESARSLHCNKKKSAATNNSIYFDIHFVREHFNCTMDDLVFRCIFFCARSYHPFHFCLSKCLMVVELLFSSFHVKCVKNTKKNHAVNHNLGFIV